MANLTDWHGSFAKEDQNLQDDQQAFMLILHSGQSLYATKCDAQQPTKSLRLPQNNSSFTLVDSYVVKVPSWTAS